MFLDKLLQFSDGQNVTATAVSTNVIDLSVDRKIGIGEPIGVVISASTDFGGTTPTIDVQVQTDDNEGFASPSVVATSGVRTEFAEGDKIVVPLGFLNERYLRLNFVMGGTSPDTTLDAYLQPLNMIDGYEYYADGYNIT